MKSHSPTPNRLETQLRRSPTAPLPSDLHGSIVSAVRSAKAVAPEQPSSPLWLPASVLAVWLALGGWWAVTHREADATLKGTEVTQTAVSIPEEASAAVLAPLQNELDYLNGDLRKAMDFLVASVP